MIRTLALVLVIGAAGSVSLAPPLSMWALLGAIFAAILLGILAGDRAANWIGARVDARRRANLDVRTWRPR